jgi:Tol biopolymer transport system component
MVHRPRLLLLLAFVSGPTALGLSAQVQAPAPTIDDLLNLKRVASPAISPDGGLVAYTVRETNWDENAYETEIWVGDGTRVRQLTTGRKSSVQPAWSPDGQWIAFVSDRDGKRQLYRIAVAGGEAERLTSFEEDVSAFAWSPDGARIAFTCEGPPPRWEFDLCVVPATRDLGYGSGGTGGVLRVTTGTAVDSDPAWSPDGTRIAFTTDREGQGRNSVALVGADGSGYEPLVVGEDPAWSPEGTRIVFVGGTATPGLYLVNADGSGLVRITDDPADHAPSWGR